MSAGPIEFASLGFEPLYYRPHGAGDWSGHIPFAYDLVADLRPSRIVELGTYYGESYFAFCQGVAECGVACQASAVDTWRGDSQTGAYGEAVFREVSAHNQKHYAGFSTLLRESFDDATKHFGDGSIDLLHIDGLHTYEAVRHDFESWLPMVSPGGMVLLHDTQIRYGDFGVWRLWQELRAGYDSFEFFHSCGLGVIRKPGGARALTGLSGLLFGDRQKIEATRRFYRVCGERLEYKDRLERQQTHGKWGILVKLYWREGGQEFSEARSSHVRDDVAVSPKGIRMELPRGATFGQLRFDLLESPPFMRLHAIRLLGLNGALLWSLPMLRVQEFLLLGPGIRLSPEVNGCNIMSRISGGEGSVCINPPQAVLDQLGAGAELELELSSLEPEDCATALDSLQQRAPSLAVAADCRAAALQEETNVLRAGLAEAQSEVKALARGLAEAQDLVAERESQLSTYDQALCLAQKLALEREAEPKELHRKYGEALDSLRRAEESLAFQEAHVNKLAEILEQTRRELAGREEQLCNLATQLSELQREATTREQDLVEEREKLRRVSDWEHLYNDCSRRLREIESSLAWKVGRRLRGLKKP